MPLRQLRRGLRALRSTWHRWSPQRDRQYHDSLFGAQQIDPFQFSYPGHITIRRFADLSAPRIAPRGQILDLGCGTGEITCELARRFPDATFEGVDHSEAGIARAQHHAQTLSLSNITFRIADAEHDTPARPVDLITMFDSFHHVTKPAAFIERMGNCCSRFLLIEPQGDWKGSWAHEMDFDWLASDVDRIRAHVAYATGEPPPSADASGEGGNEHEEPIEHRYAIEDFEHFFSGYGLELRGTVAGLETYPPAPARTSASRERFGKLAYELYAEVDDLLRERDLDLFAKHLVIYAERGLTAVRRRRPSKPVSAPDWTADIRGAHDVRYLSYDGPRQARPGQELIAQVRLRNESWRRWTSDGDDTPDLLSYHWLDRHGAVVDMDGVRTSLPRTLLPGEEMDVALNVRTPEAPGRYLLAIDMVQESTTWFSDAGSPCLRIPVTIRR